jgi:hypothetical protein
MPSDIDSLVRAANLLATLYREALEWSLRVRRCVGGQDVTSLVNSMERLMAESVIKQLKEFGFGIRQKIKESEEAIGRGESRTTSLHLGIQMPKTDGLIEIVKDIAQSFKKS